MEARWVDADGSYGNARDVIGKRSPPRERADAQRAPYGQRCDQVVETGSGRSTKPYECVDCRYATDRKNNLRRHRATMHERCDRALECCGLTFVSKSELREHVAERHGAGAGYACAECGRRFGRRALMRRHAAVHALAAGGGGGRPPTDGQRRRVAVIGRRYACSQCDYATGHKSNLDRHLRRHVGLPSISVDSQSVLGSGGRYPPSSANNVDEIQSVALSAIGQRDLGVARNRCRCYICMSTLYYCHQLQSTPLSSQAPFMFSLLPPRLVDVARSFFCRSTVSDVDARPLWSVEGHGPLRETASDTGNLVGDDLPTSKDGDGRLHREGQSQTCEGVGDWSTSSTTSTGDDAADMAATRDVTGTCHQPRRRLRLLPLLHTCRSCSLTFVSQLQLKFHSDLFHRAADVDAADARPICCRANQPRVRLP